MARQQFGSEPGLEYGLVYSDNGKVTDLYCVNETGADIYLVAVLEPGTNGESRTIGGVMRGDMVVPLPENAVRRTVDSEGEPRFSGILSIGRR